MPVSLQPKQAAAAMTRAIELQGQGRPAEALAIYRTILLSYPEHPDALHNAGTAAFAIGEHLEAERLLLLAIFHDNRHAAARSNLALLWSQLGSGQEINAIAFDPTWVGCFTTEANDALAKFFYDRREPARAKSIWLRILDAGQRRAEFLIRVADCEMQLEAYGAAAATYQAALEEKPDESAALLGLGRCLLLQHAMTKTPLLWRRARAILEELVTRDPTNAKGLYSLGEMAEEDGDFGDAERYYRKALQCSPDFVNALSNLVALRGAQIEDSDVMHLVQLAAAVEQPTAPRAKALKALGKRYDARGDFAGAFDCFARANALKSRDAKFDAHAHKRHVDRIIATYGSRNTPIQSDAARGSNLIFIVGMPRSGTTLLDQILSAHPSIASAGEIGFFVALDRNDEALHGELPKPLPDVIAQYQSALKDVDPGARWIVDKMPFNFLQVGMILAAFPSATIVHCTRDRNDTALSCFFENFNDTTTFALTWEGIRLYIDQYVRIMRHWQTCYAENLVTVRYEDMVQDYVRTVTAVLERIGAGWSDECHDYAARGTVRTPSRWQVRQPIYASSVGRWKNYRQFFDGGLDAA